MLLRDNSTRPSRSPGRARRQRVCSQRARCGVGREEREGQRGHGLPAQACGAAAAAAAAAAVILCVCVCVCACATRAPSAAHPPLERASAARLLLCWQLRVGARGRAPRDAQGARTLCSTTGHRAHKGARNAHTAPTQRTPDHPPSATASCSLKRPLLRLPKPLHMFMPALWLIMLHRCGNSSLSSGAGTTGASTHTSGWRARSDQIVRDACGVWCLVFGFGLMCVGVSEMLGVTQWAQQTVQGGKHSSVSVCEEKSGHCAEILKASGPTGSNYHG
jgi:hypothetical protein